MTGVADVLRDPAVAAVFDALDGRGEAVRIVGGAVRNALFGLPSGDIDFATTAVPEGVVDRARAAGFRTLPTGLAHGTVTLLVHGRPFEVTTLRADIDTDGRHATVRFSRSFEEDALRRDFTVNALSLTRDGQVHDPVEGLPDIAARRIRFIGDADRRIAEDHLRTLRFFRLHAVYGRGALDATGLGAAVRQRASLRRLSAERIAAELWKLLPAAGATAVVAVMSETGILPILLGGIGYPPRLARCAAIEDVDGTTPDPVLRLAALAVALSEDVERLRERLRLSNERKTRLANAAALLERLHGSGPPTSARLREIGFLHGAQALADALRLAHVDGAASAEDAAWWAARRDAASQPAERLPLSGADLLARGVAPGPAVGALLKRFQAAWIRAGFPKEPDRLAQLLDSVVRTLQDPP